MVVLIVVEGALLGVDCFAVGGVEDCFVFHIYQNIVANLRKIRISPVCVLEAVHELLGLNIEDLEGSFEEDVVIVGCDGKLAARDKEQRLFLIGGLLRPCEYQNIAGPHVIGMGVGKFDDRRVERDQDFAFGIHKACAVDIAFNLDGDTVEAPSEIIHIHKGTLVNGISFEIAE